MTENKKTVERYMDGFNRSDHEQILSCLTEDIEWKMPGAFHLVRKDAFDKEIENDAFVGSPAITITRMVEEDDVVIAEGAVRVKKKHGGSLNAVFCDLCHEKFKNQTPHQLSGRIEIENNKREVAHKES